MIHRSHANTIRPCETCSIDTPPHTPISAWFFLDREQTIKSNLKRVWIMERELLFWSLAFVAFYLMFDGPTSA